jgi:hypothetical protein
MNQISRLSQAFTTHHPNVFTPILSLSEERAGIAWVPSNEMLFSPVRYIRFQIVKQVSTHTYGFFKCFHLSAITLNVAVSCQL